RVPIVAVQLLSNAGTAAAAIAGGAIVEVITWLAVCGAHGENARSPLASGHAASGAVIALRPIVSGFVLAHTVVARVGRAWVAVVTAVDACLRRRRRHTPTPSRFRDPEARVRHQLRPIRRHR